MAMMERYLHPTFTLVPRRSSPTISASFFALIFFTDLLDKQSNALKPNVWWFEDLWNFEDLQSEKKTI
jgi:hypothetical protein